MVSKMPRGTGHRHCLSFLLWKNLHDLNNSTSPRVKRTKGRDAGPLVIPSPSPLLFPAFNNTSWVFSLSQNLPPYSLYFLFHTWRVTWFRGYCLSLRKSGQEKSLNITFLFLILGTKKKIMSITCCSNFLNLFLLVMWDQTSSDSSNNISMGFSIKVDRTGLFSNYVVLCINLQHKAGN